MSRILKRVPMDFNWPLNKKWDGYLNPDEIEDFEHIDPPLGDGYQMWENVTEGSPQSPVFATIDELAEWCSKNATTFAHFTAPAEQWRVMLLGNRVHHQEGNVIFM